MTTDRKAPNWWRIKENLPEGRGVSPVLLRTICRTLWKHLKGEEVVKGPGQVRGQHQSQACKRQHMAGSRGTDRLLGSRLDPAYRTLYTPQEAPCTWRGTVDKSILPETDLDRCCCPGAWRHSGSHTRGAVGLEGSLRSTHAMLKDGLASWSVTEAVVC